MRFLFEEIFGKCHRYSITDSQWFPASEECLLVAVNATVSVSRQDNETVMIRGGVEGRCKVACDRCGEQYEENLQSEFTYLATMRAEDSFRFAEQECSDADALVLYLEEPAVELDEILREQALLAVPLKKLCSEDCRGICAGCGLVLSREPCRCQSGRSDSPFAVLKRLRNQ